VSDAHPDATGTPSGTGPGEQAAAGPTGPARPAPEQPAGEQPAVVIRDNRRVDPSGRIRAAAGGSHRSGPGPRPGPRPDEPAPPGPAQEEPVPDEEAATVAATPTGQRTDGTGDAGTGEATGGTAFAAEVAALRAEVDERTRDLQRIGAEYANYRKRVERDKSLVGEQAVGAVLVTLLPVLDDLDRAREHGDLVGPFGAVAEQFTATLMKFGLTPFGDRGDRFDPTVHEAVSHSTSADVTEATCVDILRRGYLLGERLLRPALVAVADPE